MRRIFENFPVGILKFFSPLSQRQVREWLYGIKITEDSLELTDVTINDTSVEKHGFCPKLSGNDTDFLDGVGKFDSVKDEDVVFSDITINNTSTGKHGYCPKLSGNNRDFLDGEGDFDTVKDFDVVFSDNINGNVDISKHGYCPKAPDLVTHYLRGDAIWAPPLPVIVADERPILPENTAAFWKRIDTTPPIPRYYLLVNIEEEYFRVQLVAEP